MGDILLQGERGAHIIVAPEVAEYIMTSLASVRSVPVKNTAIPLSELGVRPPVTKEVGEGGRARSGGRSSSSSSGVDGCRGDGEDVAARV